VKLAPEHDAIARQALNKVLERAQSACSAGDLETAIANLMSTRDAIVGAAMTLRGLDEATRAQALRKLEQA
jgi:hypothetical protein